MGLGFGVLGPLQVLEDGRPVAIPAAQQRLILTTLLLQPNTVVSTDRLIDALWPDAPPPTALAAVRTYVMRLRRALGETIGPRIQTRGTGYVLEVLDGELDTERFDTLRARARTAADEGRWDDASRDYQAALDQWRGDLLAGESPESWQPDEVARLTELRLQTASDRIDAEFRLGRHAESIAELRALATAHPLREAFHAKLMLALYLAGRQAEALDVHQTLRRTLNDELGLEPGDDIRELHQSILRADAHLTAPPAAPHPAAAPTRRELPTDVPDFIGRAADLWTIVHDDSDSDSDGTSDPAEATTGAGAVRVVAVDGMAGVGKTALTVHAAHLLAEHHTDGQLYLDLRGYTPGREPLDPDTALRVLLGSLGAHQAKLPDTTAELAALWRTELAGRRILIVLDNAATAEQVRPLIPGSPGCTVLITSRRRLPDLDGARHVTLGVLPHDEALTLFGRAVGGPRPDAEPDAAAEVAELCGRLPLAIRIAAGRLRHRPAWSVADLAELLRDEQSRLAELGTAERSVAAAFAVSEQALDADQQRMFRLLGLVPGQSFDAYVAAALAGIPVSRARRILEDLLDVHLLHQLVAGRFTFHDLMRQHARDSVTSAEPRADREAAVHRMLDYYLHTAAAADRHHEAYSDPGASHVTAPPAAAPDVSTPERADQWMRMERSNVYAAVQYAAGHGYLTHAVDLPAVMLGYLQAQGHFALARSLQQVAVQAAGDARDLSALAAATTDLASSSKYMEQWTAAREQFAAALEAFRSLGDRRGQATVLTELGGLDRLVGDYEPALGNFRAALDEFRRLGDQRGQATVLTYLADVLCFTRRFEEVPAIFREAEAMFHACGDKRGEGNSVTMAAEFHNQAGDYAAAEAATTRGLVIFRELGNVRGQANAQVHLGYAMTMTGRYTEAAEALNAAIAVFRDVENKGGEAFATYHLGQLYLRTGRYAEAYDALRRSHADFHAVQSRLGEARTLIEIGDVLCSTGRHDQASDTLREALAMTRDLGDSVGEADVLTRIGDLGLAVADLDAALENHAAALDLARSIESQSLQARALEGVGRVHLARGDEAAGADHLRRALAIDERTGSADAVRLRRLLQSSVSVS